MERLPVLVATGGLLTGRRYPVTARGLILGRDESCDVPINDPNISRQHVRVLLHNGAVWVQDAGSRNGVFVNSKRLMRPRQLAPGDVLNVGTHTFTVDLGQESDIQQVVDDPLYAPPSVPRSMTSLIAPVVIGILVALVVVAVVAGWWP